MSPNRLLPSRARPIRARLSTPSAAWSADEPPALLTQVRAQFDPADGWPLAAMWLPVTPDSDADGTWVYLDAQQRPLAHPTVADIQGEHAHFVPPLASDEPARNWVDLGPLVWPARAEHAMLLTLHNQTQGVGEGFIEVQQVGDAGWLMHLQAALPELIHQMLAARRNGTLNWDPLVAIVHKPQVSEPAAGRKVQQTERNEPEQLRSWVLAVGSCAYPSQVFDASSKDHRRAPPRADLTGPADQSLVRLAQRFAPEGAPDAAQAKWLPQAAIFTGDQVYVDATAGLFDPGYQGEALRFAYARKGDAPGWRALSTAAGAFWSMFDDHELRDNWSPGQDPQQDELDLQAARAHYLDQQRAPHWPQGIGPQADGSLDAEVSWPGGLPVYALDVRTHRSARTADALAEARIMDARQWQRLQGWLDRSAGAARAPCFIASSSIVLPRRLRSKLEPAMALYEDSWGGFPAARARLLGELWTRGASNVILISGDEHMGCVARIRVHAGDEAQAIDVLSVHAPALYAPYPFANGHIDEFVTEADAFDITHEGVTLHVSVQPWFPPPEAGFVLVRCTRPDQGPWQTAVQYDLVTGQVDVPVA